MKLNCMAGRGIVAKDECLACALNRKNECGYDYALLRKMLNHDEQVKRSTEVHVTDITGCLRRAYYTKMFPKPEFPHETLARFLGVGFHSMVEGSDEVLDSELSLDYGNLVGTSDVVYKDGVIVDYKFQRWLKPKYLPNDSHIKQVNIYAHMLRGIGRKVKRAFIQYVDASGPSKCRKCRIPVRMFEGEIKCPECFGFVTDAHLGAILKEVELFPSSEVEEMINERVGELQSSLDLQALPDAEVSFLCKYCNYYEECGVDANEIFEQEAVSNEV